ncbi:major facilitator superfamily domain-containing protein 6-like [Brevipalpus obovatus]|uniref:major facilitator superfamily domain-containing protein 6-like n=1 Tax=Brevipalpus obovatus TaxID=246614 RepID=UPI003D9EE710
MTVSFVEDLRLKELAPVKLLLFLQSAGDMALYPFFTLHMRSLGINLTEIGIQYAISPVATLIATPLLGLLVDRVGHLRQILSLSLIICAIIGALIVMIPKISQLPECVLRGDELTTSCPSVGSLSGRFLNLTLPECLKQKSLASSESSLSTGRGLEKTITTSRSLALLSLINCRVYCNNNNSQLCLYFESDGNYCFNLEPNSSHRSGKYPSFTSEPLTIALSPDSDQLFIANQRNVEASLHTVSHNSKTYLDLTCRSSDRCDVRCPLISQNAIPHHYQNIVPDPGSKRLTFWLYLVLRVALFVTVATEMSLVKATILTLVDKNKTEYGYQRVWASIANVFIPPLTGIAMDRAREAGSGDFLPCFIVYCSFKLTMALVTVFIKLDIKPPATNVMSKLNQLIRSREVVIFLFYVTFIGSTWGFIETFIALFLEELNASRFAMGLCSTVAALSGIPFSIYAGFFERRLGHITILVIGLMVYSVRLLGYSFANNALMVLGFEALEGITTTLMLITITTYASSLSSLDLLTTMQATWAALHFSVGRAMGSMVGGFLFDRFGSRRAYQMWSVACIVAASMYLLLYFTCLRSGKVKKIEEDEKKKPSHVNGDKIF